MNDELVSAVREAIEEATHPDDILTVQAQAAVEAMIRAGWVQAYGYEYAVKRGDVIVEAGFNTLEQAEAYAPNLPGAVIQRRPVGVWEDVEELP
jgi:hypothetical protein